MASTSFDGLFCQSGTLTATWLGEQLQIFGNANDPTYREHWPLIEPTATPWTSCRRQGALINEQMWRATR